MAAPARRRPGSRPAATAPAELLRRRAVAQLLTSGPRSDPPAPPNGPANAVSHLLAVQAQDPRAARLALRARGAARHEAEVDAALTIDRSLVAGWLARSASCSRDWLDAAERPPDRDAALAELARRYLRGHGPATEADLATWSGLPLRDARAGLAAITAELEHEGALLDLIRRPPVPKRLPPRLLGAFDPYLLGWCDRGFAVAPEHARRVHPGGGILRATALANGRAVGTWARRRGKVVLEPFEPLPDRVAAAFQREARDIARFEA